MRSTTRALVAIALLALTPAAAAAQPEPGSAVPELGPRDYGKNAANGEYRGPTQAERALALRGEALNRMYAPGAPSGLPSRPQDAPAAGAGFAWGDAAVGAGVVLALSALLGSYAVVRRRIGPAGMGSPGTLRS
jgi:hypothetical protein